mgnify:CR=1 FL=1
MATTKWSPLSELDASKWVATVDPEGSVGYDHRPDHFHRPLEHARMPAIECTDTDREGQIKEFLVVTHSELLNTRVTEFGCPGGNLGARPAHSLADGHRRSIDSDHHATGRDDPRSVSYTHLTLPTSDLV